MLELSRVAPHEWEFVYPAIYDDLMNEFHTGCESYEEGNLDDAESIFHHPFREKTVDSYNRNVPRF